MRGWLIAGSFAFVACGGESSPPPPAAPMASAAPAPAPCAADDDYKAAAPPTGAKPDLPPVPEVTEQPRKTGDAFTVSGAVLGLRSRYDSAEVTKQPIAIVGYIIDSNVTRAPKCAWHKTGVADPPGCAAEIPTFVIADAKDTKPDDPKAARIKVLGWARNWSAVFDATAKYKGLTARPNDLYKDEMWNVDVPYPIPAVGQKVKVTGRYGFIFSKSSGGLVSDPRNGVLTYESMALAP